ncbi:MAG: RNA 2',3'-cyclic phosphodiesterase [Persicimonas sp.]
MKRLFIAVDLPEEVVERLVDFQADLRAVVEDREDVRVKWTRPEQLHVTIKFLGDTDPDAIPALRAALEKSAADRTPFEAEAQGLGFFPDPGRPRIIWSGFDEEGTRRLQRLHGRIERGLAALGVDQEDRPFVPHVTLGRVKSRARPDGAQLSARVERRAFGAFSIDAIVLYESQLDHRGAIHTPLEHLELGS